MDAIELTLDQALFTAEVLLRTAHRYTADYYVDVRASADSILVRLTPKRADLDNADLALRFCNDALDDRLRIAVAAQTNDLQATLVRAALEEAQPRVRSGS